MAGTPPNIFTDATSGQAALYGLLANDEDLYAKLDPEAAKGAYAGLPQRLSAIEADLLSAGDGDAKVRVGTNAERLAYASPSAGLIWVESDTPDIYRYDLANAKWVKTAVYNDDGTVSVAEPTDDGHAASKGYVDQLVINPVVMPVPELGSPPIPDEGYKTLGFNSDGNLVVVDSSGEEEPVGKPLRQAPIYLSKSITFTASSSGTETTDVSGHNLGPNAVVLSTGTTGGSWYYGGSGAALGWNVALTSDRQTVDWNWENIQVSTVSYDTCGAVILDFV